MITFESRRGCIFNITPPENKCELPHFRDVKGLYKIDTEDADKIQTYYDEDFDIVCVQGVYFYDDDITSSEKQLLDEFGSFMDWYPIYKDSEDNIILYNINKDSKFYQKICLSIYDNHTREGMFVVQEPLEEFLTELEEYDKIDWKTLEEEDCPIIKAMIKRDFDVYFG